MKTLKTVSILIAIMLLAGCVLSAEPFFTEEYVIELPELYGKWQQIDEDGKPHDEKPLEFDGNKILTYDRDLPGALQVTYFKIGDLIFADTKIENLQEINAYHSVHLIDGHMVSKITVAGDRLSVRTLDIFWFEKYIKQNPFAKTIQTEDYKLFVTDASPQDWVDLLKKYGADGEAFPEKGTLFYIRK